MIRFITNSNQFESMLREVMDYEIDYLSPTDGILYIEDDKKGLLELFCLQMSQERNLVLTCLDCYGQDEMTYQALLLAQKLGPGEFHKLSKILLLAIIQNNQIVLDQMEQFVKGIDPYLLEFGKAYIEQDGHGLNTAQHLYIHRNTVNNRLEQFFKSSLMDLREAQNRQCLEICLTYTYYKE